VKKDEVEIDEMREQGIMEERIGKAFAGTGQKTAVGAFAS